MINGRKSEHLKPLTVIIAYQHKGEPDTKSKHKAIYFIIKIIISLFELSLKFWEKKLNQCLFNAVKYSVLKPNCHITAKFFVRSTT